MAPIQTRIQLELRDEDLMRVVVLQKDIQLAALPPVGTLIQQGCEQFTVKAIELVMRAPQPVYYLITAGAEYWRWDPESLGELQALGWN
jgi:hypothetical protein